MGFRTVFGNNTHRHVVLALSWNGIYGALGMSRRDDLMYKPLIFSVSVIIITDPLIIIYHCIGLIPVCTVQYYSRSVPRSLLPD